MESPSKWGRSLINPVLAEEGGDDENLAAWKAKNAEKGIENGQTNRDGTWREPSGPLARDIAGRWARGQALLDGQLGEDVPDEPVGGNDSEPPVS